MDKGVDIYIYVYACILRIVVNKQKFLPTCKNVFIQTGSC